MLFNLNERLNNIRMVTRISAFVKEPESINNVVSLAKSLEGSPLSEQMIRYLMNHSDFSALVNQGWRPKPINLDELQGLPEGSLGRSYADQLIRLGISPDVLIDTSPINSDGEYIAHRIKETHDIVHVLTGFGIDGCGEIGLQAFNLAQYRSPLAVMLIFGAMLGTLQNDESLEPMLKALSKGFQKGIDADLIIGHKLEEGWERPINEWRERLNLPRIN